MATQRETDTARDVELTDEEWRERLTPEQYEVLRKHGTERPFTGEYVDVKDDGTYRCAGCGAELFSSDTKFDSGTGWPSFYEPAVAENVELREDRSLFMARTEVLLQALRRPSRPRVRRRPAPTGLRYCINSCALDLDANSDRQDSPAQSRVASRRLPAARRSRRLTTHVDHDRQHAASTTQPMIPYLASRVAAALPP